MTSSSSTATVHPRRRLLAVIVGGGLVLTGLGFLVAGVRPGAGPRLVTNGSDFAGHYLPPVLAGIAVLVVAAGVVAWASRISAGLGGGLVAVVLLVGSATAGLEGIVYRLGRPNEVVPFVADGAQLLGELAAVAAAVTLSVQMALAGRRRG